MPAWREKPQAGQNFTKRRSVEANRALIDAAHRSAHRLYCDALQLWRFCRNKKCKRHRRCCGEPTACLLRGLPAVPPAKRLKARHRAALHACSSGAPASCSPSRPVANAWPHAASDSSA